MTVTVITNNSTFEISGVTRVEVTNKYGGWSSFGGNWLLLYTSRKEPEGVFRPGGWDGYLENHDVPIA